MGADLSPLPFFIPIIILHTTTVGSKGHLAMVELLFRNGADPSWVWLTALEHGSMCKIFTWGIPGHLVNYSLDRLSNRNSKARPPGHCTAASWEGVDIGTKRWELGWILKLLWCIQYVFFSYRTYSGIVQVTAINGHALFCDYYWSSGPIHHQQSMLDIQLSTRH